MAKEIKCKNCGKTYDGSICPHCNSKYSKHSPAFYGGIGAIAIFLVVVISIFAAGIVPFPSSKNITIEEYEKIQTGMTHKEVSEIVGSTGKFISDENISGNRYTVVRWRKSLSTTGLADVYFINGRVDSKNEFGL